MMSTATRPVGESPSSGAGAAPPRRLTLPPPPHTVAPLDPARYLPRSAPPVYFDVPGFRRAVGGAGLRAVPLTSRAQVEAAWPPVSSDEWSRHSARGRTDLEHSIALDPAGVQFAIRAFPHPVWRHTSRRGVDDVVPGSADDVLGRRIRHHQAVIAHARELAAAHVFEGGLPHLVGHIAPDASIMCPVERGFAFAARAIAAGVDHALARALASAVIVTAGLPLPTWTLREDIALSGVDDGLWPRETLMTQYYEQALVDLRGRGDARRFMHLAARGYASALSGHGAPTHAG